MEAIHAMQLRSKRHYTSSVTVIWQVLFSEPKLSIFVVDTHVNIKPAVSSNICVTEWLIAWQH